VTVLAVSGWVLAVAGTLAALALRRRLELVARADHELRGPLAALVLGVEMLARDPRGARAARALETHVARAQAGLRDLSAARAGRRSAAQAAPVVLERAVVGAAIGWRPVVRRAGRSLTLDWRAGAATAHVDRHRLDQAMGNVLANAVEHGAGPVELRGHRVAGGVRIEVSNERAVADEPPAGAAGGTRGWGRRGGRRRGDRGRGLAIAARAVEEAGGRLVVESAAPGGTYPDRRRVPEAPPRGEDRRGPGEGRATVAIELPLDPT
jgi:signal transduction histidine kinase